MYLWPRRIQPVHPHADDPALTPPRHTINRTDLHHASQALNQQQRQLRLSKTLALAADHPLDPLLPALLQHPDLPARLAELFTAMDTDQDELLSCTELQV